MTKKLEEALNAAGYETTQIDRASTRDGPVWSCKIGLKKGTFAVLPGGADLPMREAVEDAFRKITGLEADFTFSGWGAELTKDELDVVNESDPQLVDEADVVEAIDAYVTGLPDPVEKDIFGGDDEFLTYIESMTRTNRCGISIEHMRRLATLADDEKAKHNFAAWYGDQIFGYAHHYVSNLAQQARIKLAQKKAP